jgi:hypothetical protein
MNKGKLAGLIGTLLMLAVGIIYMANAVAGFSKASELDKQVAENKKQLEEECAKLKQMYDNLTAEQKAQVNPPQGC